MLAAEGRRSTAAVLALLGVVLLAGSLLLRAAAFVGPALACTGAAYAVAIAGRRAVDTLVVVLAPLLLLAAELGYWSLESAVAHEDRGLLLRRAGTVAAIALLSSAVAAFLVASSNLDLGGGVALLGAGVAAATGVLALVAQLARRGARRV